MTTQVEWPLGCIFMPYDEVKDLVSGWKGKVTAEYLYANGCVRYEISGSDKDGKPVGYVFDQEQLELVKKAKPLDQPKPTGGPRNSKPVER